MIAGGKSIGTTKSLLHRTGMPDELIELGIARHELRLFDIHGVDVVEEQDSTHTPWYPGPQAGDQFWPPVRARLETRLPQGAVEDIDHVTSLILSKLKAPGTPQFSTRGLVVGYVQSGKTTNFMALAAKAADKGYKLIVVLSGITDILRNQTQERVDDVLVGDSEQWYRLTKDNADFAETGDAAPLFVNFNGALLAVVKKNPHRLRRLRDWMKNAGRVAMQHAPLLLIDDEADQASIDVGDDRTSTINALLRDILTHPRSAYVAYTATPFANLLIDPNNETDLYPKDLIVSMSKPNDYFGPEQLFGESDDPADPGLDAIRTIPDAEAAAARPPKGVGAVNTWSPATGSELRRALIWFLLSTAARRARTGKRSDATMLVHSSMLSEAHFRIAGAISQTLEALSVGIATADKPLLAELREVWESESARVPASRFDNAPVEWDELQQGLRAVTADVEVIVDNFRSTDRLRYSPDHPTTAVVVGGNTLSRGLTLEGLTSSYFVRAASAYDTLLQMGRWFGYRAGYEDLCRIWMTDELRGWFRDLSLVEQEIRDEISRYARERLTPTEVGVRIRLHPDLAITEAAKMRNAIEASLSFSGRSPQTTIFRRLDADRLGANLRSVRSLIEDIIRYGGEPSAFRAGRSLKQTATGFRDVPAELILRLLANFAFDEDQPGLTAELLDGYIRGELQNGSLLTWRVVLTQGPSGEEVDFPGVGTVRSVVRSRLADTESAIANIRALMSAEDRIAGMDWADDETPPTGVDLLELRAQRHPKDGILRVYPIDRVSAPKGTDSTRVPLDAAAVVVGLGIDFPTSIQPDAAIGYVVAAVPRVDLESPDDRTAADRADEENPDVT